MLDLTMHDIIEDFAQTIYWSQFNAAPHKKRLTSYSKWRVNQRQWSVNRHPAAPASEESAPLDLQHIQAAGASAEAPEIWTVDHRAQI